MENRIIIPLGSTGSVEETRLHTSSITPCGDTAITLLPVLAVGEGQGLLTLV